MTRQELAEKSIRRMLSNDAFSRWLGIRLLEVIPGKVVLQMTVRKEMMNGFNVCHGGITFAFADSALAFASNSHGRLSLLLKASISYPEPVYEGDVLTAVTEEQSLNKRVGIYTIIVTKNDHVKVAIFHGTVYRTKREILDSIQSLEKTGEEGE